MLALGRDRRHRAELSASGARRRRRRVARHARRRARLTHEPRHARRPTRPAGGLRAVALRDPSHDADVVQAGRRDAELVDAEPDEQQPRAQVARGLAANLDREAALVGRLDDPGNVPRTARVAGRPARRDGARGRARACTATRSFVPIERKSPRRDLAAPGRPWASRSSRRARRPPLAARTAQQRAHARTSRSLTIGSRTRSSRRRAGREDRAQLGGDASGWRQRAARARAR